MLDVAQSRLTAKVRAVARGDAIPDAIALPDRSAEIVTAGPPPPLIDARAVGVLAVEDGLGFGPSGTEMTRDALPGVWFAYQDGEPDDPAMLLIVHQAHIATFRDDRLHDMRRDLDAGGKGIHPNRCIRFGLGGDGVWTAATVNRDGVLVALIARSRDRS